MNHLSTIYGYSNLIHHKISLLDLYQNALITYNRMPSPLELQSRLYGAQTPSIKN